MNNSQGQTQLQPQVDLEELIANRLLSAYTQFIQTRGLNIQDANYENLAHGIRNLVISLELNTITCQANPATDVNNWQVNPQADLSVFESLELPPGSPNLSPSVVNNVWEQISGKPPCASKNIQPIQSYGDQQLCMSNPTLPQCAGDQQLCMANPTLPQCSGSFGGTRNVPKQPMRPMQPYLPNPSGKGAPYLPQEPDMMAGAWQGAAPQAPVDESGYPITPEHPAFCDTYPQECKKKQYPLTQTPRYCKTHKDLPECKANGKRDMLSISSPNCALFPFIPSCHPDLNPAQQLLCLRFPQLQICKKKSKHGMFGNIPFMPSFPQFPGMPKFPDILQMPNMGSPSHMMTNIFPTASIIQASMIPQLAFPQSTVMTNPESEEDCFEYPVGPHCAPLLYPGSPLCEKFNWLPICVPPKQPSPNSLGDQSGYYPTKQPQNPYLIQYCNENPSMPECDTQNIINNLTPDQRLPLILHICKQFSYLQPCQDLQAGRYCDQFPTLEYCQNSQSNEGNDFAASPVSADQPNGAAPPYNNPYPQNVAPSSPVPTLMPPIPPAMPENPPMMPEAAPTMIASPVINPANVYNNPKNPPPNNMPPAEQPQIPLVTINFNEPSTVPFGNNRSPEMPGEMGATMPGQAGSTLMPMNIPAQPGNEMLPYATAGPEGESTLRSQSGIPNMPGQTPMLGGNTMIPGDTMMPSSFMPGGSSLMPSGSSFMPEGSSFMPGGSSLLPGNSMAPGETTIPMGDTTITGGSSGMPGDTTMLGGVTESSMTSRHTGLSSNPSSEGGSTGQTGTTMPDGKTTSDLTGSTGSGGPTGSTIDDMTSSLGRTTGTGGTGDTGRPGKTGKTDKQGKKEKGGTTPMPGGHDKKKPKPGKKPSKGGSRTIGRKPPCHPGYCQQSYQMGSPCFHKAHCRGQGLPPECSQFPYLSKCRVMEPPMYPVSDWGETPYGQQPPNDFPSGNKRTGPKFTRGKGYEPIQLPPQADSAPGIYGPPAVLAGHRPFISNAQGGYNPGAPFPTGGSSQEGYIPQPGSSPPGYGSDGSGGYNPVGYGPASPDIYNPDGPGGYNPVGYGPSSSDGYSPDNIGGYNPAGYGQGSPNGQKLAGLREYSPDKYRPDSQGGYNPIGHGPASPDIYSPHGGYNPADYSPESSAGYGPGSPDGLPGGPKPYSREASSPGIYSLAGSDSPPPDGFGYQKNGLSGKLPNGKGRAPNGQGFMPNGKGNYGPDHLGGVGPTGDAGYVSGGFYPEKKLPSRKGAGSRQSPKGQYMVGGPNGFGPQGYESGEYSPGGFGLGGYDLGGYSPFGYPSGDFMQDEWAAPMGYPNTPDVYPQNPSNPLMAGLGYSYGTLPNVGRKRTAKPGKGKGMGPLAPELGDGVGVWVGPKGIGDSPGLNKYIYFVPCVIND